MVFGIQSYKCHETYTFGLTAPWFPAYEATNVMRFMRLDRELPPKWWVSPRAKHKIVFFHSKLITLKWKLHGVWQGVLFKVSAHTGLCKMEQALQEKCVCRHEAPRKSAKIKWSYVSIVKYDVFDKNVKNRRFPRVKSRALTSVRIFSKKHVVFRISCFFKSRAPTNLT